MFKPFPTWSRKCLPTTTKWFLWYASLKMNIIQVAQHAFILIFVADNTVKYRLRPLIGVLSNGNYCLWGLKAFNIFYHFLQYSRIFFVLVFVADNTVKYRIRPLIGVAKCTQEIISSPEPKSLKSLCSYSERSMAFYGRYAFATMFITSANILSWLRQASRTT